MTELPEPTTGPTDLPALPAGDSLLRTGMLSDADARRVAEHQARTGLDFDRAAIDLALATPEDVAHARQQLQGTFALTLAPSAEVTDELVVVSDPAGPQAEAIRLLRTQIMTQHVAAGRRALAVCGAVDGSGVTYVAANLAAALAQVGLKTLLVDANLRNPRIDAIFGIDPGGPGLTTYLALETNRPERVVYPDVLPNLSIIPSGPPVGRPQELLSGARFRMGVDVLLREYDIVVFDTPASNESADALTVAGLVGYALVVARRDKGYMRDVQALAEQLGAARAIIVGSVLNEYA
ncbi:MAG: CpsD/CapB family tyrosine-protein kinase [Sphingomonadaceae bacterium]|uniref:CpsD/CapB family tyrosine-protein kinase n=1 Tax=Thermaurantiacus sp. TaxID=2820283 RepID=UPI00298F0EB3|nr:CpsD/CapB family tyrosine-protein kinase [Thermaurantiacus sp.]MCS6986092.1 CpsD/CapB family tyrosine-protein kinase [Sphingomonadaceae bacterium]MDW8414692.1 CpsD/CapB family tyrosine-protein kinase [Thermaurantiacus sp.]